MVLQIFIITLSVICLVTQIGDENICQSILWLLFESENDSPLLDGAPIGVTTTNSDSSYPNCMIITNGFLVNMELDSAADAVVVVEVIV
jgi:hypothetical protein